MFLLERQKQIFKALPLSSLNSKLGSLRVRMIIRMSKSLGFCKSSFVVEGVRSAGGQYELSRRILTPLIHSVK